eukprot:613400-Amphidinium_carterae.1
MGSALFIVCVNPGLMCCLESVGDNRSAFVSFCVRACVRACARFVGMLKAILVGGTARIPRSCAQLYTEGVFGSVQLSEFCAIVGIHPRTPSVIYGSSPPTCCCKVVWERAMMSSTATDGAVAGTSSQGMKLADMYRASGLALSE